MPDITPRQQEVVDLIRRFTEKNGMPPTQQETADLMGVTKPAAVRMIKRMKNRGILQQTRNLKHRTGTVPVGEKPKPDPQRAFELLTKLCDALDGRQLTDEAIEIYGDALEFLDNPD